VSVTRVLVAVDFSGAARAALDYARECALQLGGTLSVLHVVEDREGDASGGAAPPDAESHARLALAHAITGASKAVRAQIVVVRSARPAVAILDHAYATGSELIVMGMNGQADGMDFSMGSVVQQVVRQAPCPVLTLRSGIRSALAKRA
jgi:nucleotide-binding universal stress UspA family protein